MNSERANAGGWEASEMRAWLDSDFWDLLPDDLRDCIEGASKRTNNAGYIKNDDEGDTSVVTATDDRLWLLSMCEVYGKGLKYLSGEEILSSATYDAEGTQYQLYSDQGVTTENHGFYKKEGTDSRWWLRSLVAHGSDNFRDVGSDGGWYSHGADYAGGVSPGFCF